MENHTPIPWAVACSPINGKQVIVHHKGKSLATCRGPNAENNAKHIKSAPNLLALLIDATNRLEGFLNTDCECDNTHEANGTECCLCQYRKEIASAQGAIQ